MYIVGKAWVTPARNMSLCHRIEEREERERLIYHTHNMMKYECTYAAGCSIEKTPKITKRSSIIAQFNQKKRGT
jgi:hypothetical protein